MGRGRWSDRSATRRIAGAGLAVLVVIGLAVWWSSRSSGDALDAAARIVDDDSEWSTADLSAESLAAIGDVLLDEGRDCRPAADAPGHCDAVLASAAWAQASAVRVLRCTRPGVFAVRADVATLIEDLRSGGAPDLPPVPAC